MDIVKKEGYREPTAQDDSNGYSVTRIFVVENANTTDDMEMRILTHADLPKKGDAYSALYPTLKVDKVSVEMPNELNFFHWEATVEYKTVEDNGNPGTGIGGSSIPNTVTVTPRVQQYDEAFELAYDNNNNPTIPVQSTSNEILPSTTVYSNIVLDINYNTQRFDYDWIREYKNTTNADERSIAGIAAKVEQARMIDIAPTPQTTETGTKYYNVTLSIEITDRDFKKRLMNRGFRKKGDSEGDEATEYILKKDVATGETETTGDERIDEPTKLGADGANNAPDASFPINEVITGSGADYLEFRQHKTSNWSVFEIPKNQP